MSLDIGAALRNGFGRTFERNGLLLMGAFLLLGGASGVASDTLGAAVAEAARALREPGAGPSVPFGGSGATPFALPVPLPAALALALVVALVAEAVRIVAVRTLVSDETETIPRAFVSRNIAWATVNGFVGGIVVWVLIAVGLVLLVVPGVFLAITFFFVRQEIAVEDKHFVDAMADSWSLTAGNRVELFGLALVVAAIGLLASIPNVILAFLRPALTVIAGAAIGAVTTVFGIAVAARAYDQLRAERAAEKGLDPEADEAFEFGT